MENDSVQAVLEKLKKANIRITPQRYAILEYLVENHNHPTADEIYRALEDRFPNMSVATVYNNLRLFIQIGFVHELSYGDTSSRFDFGDKKHYHAICQNCEKIVDFYYPGLEDIEGVVSKLTGFTINEHRLELYGLCPECEEKEKKEKINN
ncbi:Fur family transcriptional regulator [Melissococcus plutonius]|uniref:Transcriptional repressor n=1 Tax=Melissococcus plutonius TaxID=33970 RepID=A0A2Z5Y2A4_9ENTE|nr:Fur family transcriptional regulator [Melissococcus plutonius]BAL62104.1 Fur family transcriptional regulator [Melissococcus plutonius DAT561]MCV2497868.1 transcriptional repressor [Melissococcus plutonius]MCV2500525.1 transcriptional repressor [Melissococcus plutonius]MCV2505207.1 transcriptional repressor [Melissococcus plutonius]MCV2506483.1 transcriptional repressor [Melissococcus plutonius]